MEEERWLNFRRRGGSMLGGEVAQWRRRGGSMLGGEVAQCLGGEVAQWRRRGGSMEEERWLNG